MDPSASFCPFCGQKRGDNIVNTNEANKNAAIKCLSFKNYAAKKTEEGGGGGTGGFKPPGSRPVICWLPPLCIFSIAKYCAMLRNFSLFSRFPYTSRPLSPPPQERSTHFRSGSKKKAAKSKIVDPFALINIGIIHQFVEKHCP